MKRPAAFFPIVLALGAIIMAHPATAQDTRERPIEIEKCQTISQPGSYRLVNNLTLTGGGVCLLITANFVTIDLAGFFIMQGQATSPGLIVTTAIEAGNTTAGIAVRNGSISVFLTG